MNKYLTIVATTRNDNHGGDLLNRTKAFVTGIYDQAKKWNCPVELIIVEWNPPVGEKLLHEVLPKPNAETPVQLKYIIIPETVHNTFKNAQNIPLYQMIAKNVGIRRAEGEYILCTNIDILFSDACFKFFAEKKFETGKFYRTNRCDIPKEVLDLSSLSERLEYAGKNIIKRLGKSQGHETLTLHELFYNVPFIITLLNTFALKVWKLVHKDTFPHFVLDFEACGDFTLMSKQDWEDMEGYPELDMYSIHIDSMGLWAATAIGKTQVILPYNAPIYHIYHEDGWESDDPVRTIKFLENKPSLDYSIVWKGGMQIIKNKQHWHLNKPNWGLIDIDLPQYVFNAKDH
jgi:hypothetical protein